MKSGPPVFSLTGVATNTERDVTYQGEPAGSGAFVMRVLVIITIALIAYWAATGGLDEIQVVDTSIANTATQSE